MPFILSGALVPALVEEREFQAFCPGALHGAAEPLEKFSSPYPNPPIGPITVFTGLPLGLSKPFW